MSRHVLVNSKFIAHEDMDRTFDDKYYQFKFDSVMSSLNHNFKQDGNWKEFPGLDIPDNKANGRNMVVERARQNQRSICHVAHWNENLHEFKQRYPDMKTIKLVNMAKFNLLCFQLKRQGRSQAQTVEEHAQGIEHWAKHSMPGDIEIDMDRLMFEPDTFAPTMVQLYDNLGLEDPQLEYLDRFYHTYRAIHGLE